MKTLALGFLVAATVFADTAGPQLVSSTPAQGQDSVLPNTPIRLVFSKPMNAASIQAERTFTLYDLTNGYHSDYAWTSRSTDGLTVTLGFPDISLRVQAAYRLEINAALLKDLSGNSLAPVPPILFTTFLRPDKSGPQVMGTVPADSETGVAINTKLYVVFAKPIADLPYDAGISVTTASGPMKFTSSVAGDRILQITSPTLLPANQQITVSVAGIFDRNGVGLPAPAVFSFRTGVVADIQSQALTRVPPTGTPLALPLRVVFAKPVDPPLLAAGSVVFQSLYQYFTGETYPAGFVLSDDHHTLSIDAPGVPPGTYAVSVSIPFDRTLGKLSDFRFGVTVGVSADSTPVRLLAASPPDGASGVPVNAPIRLAYTGPVDLTGPTAVVAVAASGDPVTGQLLPDATGAVLTFKPRTTLQASTTYTVSASGLTDFAGNLLTPYSASFSTAASSTYPDAFTVLSSNPAAQASGVEPSAPISVTFTHPVDPVSLSTNYYTITDSNGPVTADYTVSDTVVTFRPRNPMANGAVEVDIYGVADLSGAVAPLFRTSFRVSGAQADITPPTVSSVSPGDGGTVLFSAAHVELQFSKPLDTTTMTASLPDTYSMGTAHFAAFRNGAISIPLRVTVISNVRVALEFSAPPDTTVTVMATTGITDLAGNRLIPFRTTVRTSGKPSSGAAYLIRQSPSDQSSGVPIDSPITALWSAPLDRSSVEQNLLVYSSDGAVAGRVQWTADSRGFAFIPSAPFRAGSAITMVVVPPAHDAGGLPITSNLTFTADYTYASPGSGAIIMTGSNFPLFPTPLNFVIDLQFNQDLSDAFLGTVKATFGKYRQEQVSCPFVRVRPRVLRFRPPIPLIANTPFSFDVAAMPDFKWNCMFTPSDSLASSSPVVIAAGPVGTAVAQNSGVSILFSEPVSPLGMPGGVKVTANGVVVPMRYAWTGTKGQALSLQPATFLEPNTTYTVLVTGFENLAGIPVPDRSWTFRTGGRIDTTPPSLLRIQPSGLDVNPNAVVSFTYDKPIAPASAQDGFLLRYTAPDPVGLAPATLGFSDDLTTVFLRPNSPLAAGATVAASSSSVFDFAGNGGPGSTGSGGSTFQVGYATASQALITGTSPDRDAAAVPVNSVIQVQSNANLTLLGGITATLTENGDPLDASWRIEGDGRTLTVIPSRLLAASSPIDVTVTGLTGDPYHFSFTTGSDPELAGPAVKAWPTGGQSSVPASIVVHLRFDERLNPLTVNASTITLSAPNNAIIDSAVVLDDSRRVVSLTPKLPLIEGQTYTVAWSLSSLAGNLAKSSSIFTVGPADNTAAQLLGIDPADGTSGVNLRPQIAAYFSRPVEFGLGDESFRLLRDGAAIAGQVTTAAGTKVTFTPSRALEPGATYRIEIRGVVDALGNAIPDSTSTFMVAGASTTFTPVRLLSSSPLSGAVGVAPDAPVRLSFNKAVTMESALSLRIAYTNAFITTRLEGNDVVIQPVVPFTGPQVIVQGTVYDSAGTGASVYLPYSVKPTQDTTPPVLEYTFPAARSNISAFGSILVLRFSEPIIVGPNAIRVIGANSSPNWYLAQDGRTVTGSPSLTPDSDITIAVGSDLTDLFGNPIAPVSFQLHVLSADESNRPMVKSVTPPAGAINVATDSPIQLQFTHVMDATSVAIGLHVTADGVSLSGSIVASQDNRGFQFKPDIPFRKGALIEVTVGPPAEDSVGQLLGSFNSSFTVIREETATTPSAISLFASTSAIDVRFGAPFSRRDLSPYVRAGSELIPSHWELRDRGWLRITPDEPLQESRQYSLVLDAHTEFPLQLGAGAVEPSIESLNYESGIVRIRFDREVNPLTITPATVRLARPDGSDVPYFADVAIDRRGLLLRLSLPEPELTVQIDGPESAGGVPMRSQRHRLTARSTEKPIQ